MEQHRPYWKVIVSLMFSLIATVLFVVVGAKLLLFFIPFVIGWFIAFIANPLVCWLEKRLKIVKKLGSAIMIVIVLGGIVLLFYFGISKLMEQIGSFITNIPELYQQLETGFENIGKTLEGFIKLMPAAVRDGLDAVIVNLDTSMGELIGKLSEPTVTFAGNFAKKIPGMFVGTIVMIISAYFFTAEREQVIQWSKSVAPRAVQVRMTMIIDNLKQAMGGYFKAQFKIMIIVGILLFGGFWFLGLHYAVLLAVVIAFLDFLPFFGTGTVMLPWILYKALAGDFRYAVILFVIYAATQLIRRFMEPKLIGDYVGMNPLLTLFFLYLGYKVGSLIGLIFAVPIGMIVINMYRAGAFDYILDDVKILMEGISKLRK